MTASDLDLGPVLTGDAAKAPEGHSPDGMVPLVVDVDGTLIKTDLLYESALQLVAHDPVDVLAMPLWLLKGKSVLKARIAEHVKLDVDSLPLHEEVMRAIAAARAEGRKVYLASASAGTYVQALGERVGADGVFSSDAGTNLSGDRKAQALAQAFGPKGFDYIGNAEIDFPVWRAARKAICVAPSDGFEHKVVAAFPDAEILARPRPRPGSYVKALRVHQWAKNVLVFLPLLAGHRFDLASISQALLAFIAFSLTASCAYICNDLLDLPGDRGHPTKRARPFASGAVPIPHGMVLGAALILCAFAVALTLPSGFAPVLLAYFALTNAYSLLFKRKVFLDVITLGGLYTIRVLGGVAATASLRSPWLLMFCLFLFLSLAIIKRCSELLARQSDGKKPPSGRGYRFVDLRMLLPLGAASAYGSVFVVALYLASADVRAIYAHADRLWLLCPILAYWVSRVLIATNRGEMHEDPVIFALKDRVSWVCGAGLILLILVSI